MKKILKKVLSIIICLTILLLSTPATSIKISNSNTIVNNDEKSNISETNSINNNTIRNNSFLRKPFFNQGEIIVKLKENIVLTKKTGNNYFKTGLECIDVLNEKYCVKNIKPILQTKQNSVLSNVYKFYFSENTDVESMIAEYNSNPYVEYAQPHYIYYTDMIPNDPGFDYQWYLYNTGQTGGTVDVDINITETWDLETGSTEVTIAVVDTGIDYNNVELKDNIWINSNEIPGNGIDDDGNGFVDDVRGWSFISNDNDTMDYWGHGTRCASIIGAIGNNDDGIAGIAWNCTIIPIKVFEVLAKTNDEVLANAIIYAVDNGADIISNSWGGYGDSQLLADAFNYASSKDVLSIASAGNDNTLRRHIPSGFENVIGVAATDHNDSRAYVEEYWASNYGLANELSAPGVDIYSLSRNNIYYNASGTSYAAPQVVGVAALLLSKNPDLTSDMIKTILFNSVDEINSDKYIGHGRLNALKTLQNIKPVTTIIDKIYPHTEEVKGILEIKGKAFGEKFEYYKLEIGHGKDPVKYNELINSTTSKNNETLITINTTQYNDGFYTIQLKACFQGEIYRDKTWILINNVFNKFHIDDGNIIGPWNGTIEHPFKNINQGVYSAGNGDELYIQNGLYKESFSIQRKIKIIGENPENTIIDGGGKGPIIHVFCDNISISGLKIQNSGGYGGYMLNIGFLFEDSENITIFDNQFYNNNFGIGIRYCNNIKISGNTIEENEWGIRILYCSNNTISDNIITYSSGIELYAYYWGKVCENNIIKNNILSYCGSLEVSNVTNSVIENNICQNCYFSIDLGGLFNCKVINNDIKNGRYFGIGLAGGSQNIVKNNTIYNCKYGISLYSSNKNNVSHNIITKGITGISVDNSCYNRIFLNHIKKIRRLPLDYNKLDYGGVYLGIDSKFNVIKENNFKQNTRDARFIRAKFNIWYHNYWNRPRVLPKIIFGRTGIIFWYIPAFNFDLRPALKPFDI